MGEKQYLCPKCGSDLLKVGVIELRGFFCVVGEGGGIGWEATRTPLDDTEGYRCAHCDAEIAWKEKESFTQLLP